MTKFHIALAINAPRVVINIVGLLTANSIYVIVVSNTANSSQCCKSCQNKTKRNINQSQRHSGGLRD